MTAPNIRPASRVTDLPPYFFYNLTQELSRLRAQGTDIIRMDMGSPDLPPARHIIQALQESAEQDGHHGYMPFGGLPHYRDAWATFYGERFGVELDPQTELSGLLGSKEGIFKLALAYVDPGDVVLVPDPGYATYTSGARFAGGEVVYMPLLTENRYLPDFNGIPPEVLRRAKLMWLNYPNNPTGAVATLEFFASAIRLARQYGFLIAHDAPYTEITYDGYRPPSLLQVPGAKDVAVEFHSLSKSANMGGWRVGVVCGNANVVETLSALQSNMDSGSFRPVLDAATVALTGDRAWQAERNEAYRQRRDIVVAGVRTAGLKAEIPPAAIYVWARLPDGESDQAYAAELLSATGIAVTPGSVFGPSGRGFVRVSLCAPIDRTREAMERWQRWAAQRPAAEPDRRSPTAVQSPLDAAAPPSQPSPGGV
jgi:LL-diaminopimelate aminotransferase